MFGSVPTVRKSLADYAPIIGAERIEEIRALAGHLQHARVLHLSATAFGGGVAELLSTLAPLMCDVGLRADWQVMRGADEFFQVTKALHNALQGMRLAWTPDMAEVWLRYNVMNAALFDERYDFVVLHDPQPAGIRAMLEQQHHTPPPGQWLWRCHIDLTDAQPAAWDFLRPYVEVYDAAIFTMEQYAKPDLQVDRTAIIPPAIDPLSPKNIPLDRGAAEAVVSRYGVDPARPMLVQVSRFDPWKDPLGVIDAYRQVKTVMPSVQLGMLAAMASDDPEGWQYFERAARRAGEDYDVHLLSNVTGVGNVEVNAFQSCAEVAIQKSLREGFGLVVAEALWKGRPVIGGNVGGIPLQIVNGESGYLVNSVEECADRSLYLLQQPELADTMGARGREHVREHFLITRYLRDYLRLFVELSGSRQPIAPQAAARGS
jgi:trehalose synthase